MLNEEQVGAEPAEGEVRPKAKRGAKSQAKPEPRCSCCGKQLTQYELTHGDNHGNCENCARERVAIARTVVHALCVDNVDSEDVAERAVSYADHLLLELARRPIGGVP